MRTFIFCTVCLLVYVSAAFSQSSEFTYQGRLVDGPLPASGPYEMRFRLFNAETGGEAQPQPGPITLDFTVAGGNAVTVNNGVFTVRLDFTAAGFPGAARFLEISVRKTAADPFAVLDPRQPISSAPHNIKSLLADGLSVACVLCVTNAQIESVDAGKVTGVVAIANGGTGSSTQNFVDLTSEQTSIGGNKTFTNPLSLSSGSAAAPSITFSGDTDTGLFRSAADTLHFSTGGVSRMFIDPNGRVGVGGFLFDDTRLTVVEDNPLATAGFGIVAQASGTTGFRRGVSGLSHFTSPQPGTSGTGVYGQAGGAATQNIGLHGIAFGAGAANIGVFGTASGGASNWAGYFQGNTQVSALGIVRSYINSDSNAGVALTLNGQPGWSVATANTGHFQIYNDAIFANAFWIDKTSNDVGIGTFTPGAKLDVVGNINTSTQYNIGGNRILSNPGSLNLFTGVNAGITNGSGAANTFVGDAAGRLNVIGNGNSFFGRAAGENSTGSSNSFVGVVAGQFATGVQNAFFGAGSGQASAANPNTASGNSFFGYQSGLVNTSGNFNAFFGSFSGRANTTGLFNSFFGSGSGIANVNGTLNSFFGSETGDSNINGHSNSFFGRKAGDANTEGSVNVFVGIAAGQSNTTGHYNTILGGAANVLASDLLFATALGAQSRVGTSDTIVLGKTAGTYDGVARPADTVQIPGNLNLLGTLTANGSNLTNLNANNITSGTLPIARGGTGSPTQNFVDLSTNQANIDGNKTFNGTLGAPAINATQFQIGGTRILSAPASGNLFAGVSSGQSNGSGNNNSFFGTQAGEGNIGGSGNAFLGRRSGQGNVGGSNNTALGEGAGFSAGDLTFATAIGAGSAASTPNTVVLGRSLDAVQVPGNLNVSGTISGNGSGLINLNVVLNTTIVTQTLSVPGNGSFNTGVANCAAGWRAVGGGHSVDGGPGTRLEFYRSIPVSGGWSVSALNDNPFTVGVTVYAVCARIN